MSSLRYNISDKLGIGNTILYSIQHCLAMFVANALIALIVYAQQVDPNTGAITFVGYNMVPAALMSAGVGTIIYLLITRFKSPVFLGSSAALIPVMSTCLTKGHMAHGNFLAVIIGLGIVGLIYTVLAIVTHFVGTKWLMKLLPPVVVGPVIAIIGLSLASFATNWSMFNSAQPVPWNGWAIGVAIITMLGIALISHYAKGKLSTLPFLVGIIGGYLLALAVTGIGHAVNNPAMQLVDFTPFTNMEWLPKFSLQLALDGAEANGFNAAQLPSIVFVAAPVALVAFCEHIGDHLNLSTVVEKNLLEDPGLSRTSLGDGVATAVGGLIGGMGNTTYGENVAVIGVSKVASVWPVLGAAILAIILGWIAPVMTWVQSIPYCVFGGAALILYGFIAISGLRNLQKVDLTESRNVIIAAVTLIAGVGGLFIQIKDFQFTGIALAMVIGILLNVILRPKQAE